MSKKQKAVAALVCLGVLLGPSAAQATETKTSSNQTLTTEIRQSKIHTVDLFPVSEPIAMDVSRSEPVYIPPSNSELIIEVALSQVGTLQDCTDLVQNALAAVGLTERRDSGGYDYGTSIGESFGYVVPASEARVGDIIWHPPGNGGHVWILLDPTTNLGVHGGMERSQVGGDGHTIITDSYQHYSSQIVVRLY